MDAVIELDDDGSGLTARATTKRKTHRAEQAKSKNEHLLTSSSAMYETVHKVSTELTVHSSTWNVTSCTRSVACTSDWTDYGHVSGPCRACFALLTAQGLAVRVRACIVYTLLM